MFDQRPRRIINGLRLRGLGSLSLPDDRITDETLELVKAIWHLKDRLHQLEEPVAGELKSRLMPRNLRKC